MALAQHPHDGAAVGHRLGPLERPRHVPGRMDDEWEENGRRMEGERVKNGRRGKEEARSGNASDRLWEVAP